MKRVWLSISLMVVSLVGLPWLNNPTRGEDNSPYPGVEQGGAGEDAHGFPSGPRPHGYA